MLGVVDLTCWASQCDPLLFVLAKSAGNQIEDRLTALNNENETALLDAYLKQSRRYPAGVLAIGGDVVLMNPYLRRMLDSGDQAALLDHAAELARSSTVTTAVTTLPSGITTRMSTVEQVSSGNRGRHVVFHVLAPVAAHSTAVNAVSIASIPGLAGHSSSWRRSCQQLERCYRDRDWVMIEGEAGSGRSKLAQAVAQHDGLHRPVALHHQRVGIGRHQRVEREQVTGVLQHPALLRVVQTDELKVPAVSLIRLRPILRGQPLRVCRKVRQRLVGHRVQRLAQ